MYKYIHTEYLLQPWHEGGEAGRVVTTCFSKSPKLACEREGTVVTRCHGEVNSTPIMDSYELWHGNKKIFERWG
jgi:hypothetical protein